MWCVCVLSILFMCTLYTCIQPFKEVVMWGSYGLPLTLSPAVCQPLFLRTSLSLHLPCRRSLAYSILADLVHHVRTQLTLNHLALAVELFSRNIHDDCLPTSIQIMSCKVCKKGWWRTYLSVFSWEGSLENAPNQCMYVCMYVCTYQCSHWKVVLNVYQIRIMCLYFGDAIVSVFLLQLLLNLVDNIRQKSEQEPKVSGSTAYILLHSRTYIHTYVVRPEHVHPLRLVESQRAARHYICTYIHTVCLLKS